jgi:hypothetical protein
MMTGFERYTKQTRRAIFLEEMEGLGRLPFVLVIRQRCTTGTGTLQ